MSKFGLGLDNMLRSYLIDEFRILKWKTLLKHTNWDLQRQTLCNFLFGKTRKRIESDKIHKGITATAGGFTDPRDVFKYSR
jgi:uridine phosphorylase